MPFIIIGALLIGLTLGLMGSGGSILTVPVLVYVLGHEGKVAIAESLAIVGGIALVTMFPYAKSHMISWRTVVMFGVPGMIGTYLGAWLSHFVPGFVQLLLFALVMLAAAVVMLRHTKSSDDADAPNAETNKSTASWFIGIEGVAVGTITGLVGVGGGFLIVPALVVFAKLPMRVAVGTSLAVISLKSFSGFYKYLDVLADVGTAIDWQTVGAFILVGIVGSFVGHRIATQLDQQLLRRAFAIFLIVMGLFVLGKEGSKLVVGASHASHPTTSTQDSSVALGQDHTPSPVGKDFSREH